MLDFILMVAIIAGYIGCGYFLTKYVRKWTANMNPYIRLVVLSFSYALIFGLGILSSGRGDPGFAFPFPIILTGILELLNWEETMIYLRSVIIPLFFLWALILVVMLIIDMVNRKLKRQAQADKQIK